MEVYKKFYYSSSAKKKLTWIYSLGTCIINGKFEPKPKELLVSTYQVIPFPSDSSSIMLNIHIFLWKSIMLNIVTLSLELMLRVSNLSVL